MVTAQVFLIITKVIFIVQVNFFIGAFHDAVMLFGMAINETIEAGITYLDGYNFTYLDGYNFTRRMWDRTFEGNLSHG